MRREGGTAVAGRGWRRSLFLARTAGPGILLAVVVGGPACTAFPDSLHPLFAALSGVVVVVVALATQNALSRQLLRVSRARFFAVAGLALIAALALLIALDLRFVEWTPLGEDGASRPIIKGWPETISAGACISDHSTEHLDECWSHRWLVEAAIEISYFTILASLGALIGLGKGVPRVFPEDLEPGYLDFDLEIRHSEGGEYRATARTIESIEACFNFSLPAELLSIWSPALHSPRGSANRSGGDGELHDPKAVGRTLFESVFGADIRSGFRSSMRSAEDTRKRGVRLRLRLSEVPELADLPWEYLYDEEQEAFLARSNRTPVVRYLPVSKAVRRVGVEPPLRVLVMVSTPRDYETLPTAHQEARDLSLALKRLVKKGEVEVELVKPTQDALQRRLRVGDPIHVFHFVGHGGFSELGDQGELVFETDAGEADQVSAESLADLFRDHLSLRLAVLNACHGASASGDDVFSGTAQKLIQHGGVPAVVAMRKEVGDGTASLFAKKFYETFAERLPIDTCMGEARKALAAKNNQEWGTPVLYLRAADGQLFARAGEGSGANG